MRILGVNAGNGVLLFPFKKDVIGNIEIRSVFHTKGDYQWRLNFGNIPLYKKLGKDWKVLEIEDVDVIISHPDCGHSSVLAYSRAKKFGNPKENESLLLFFKSVSYYKPKVFLMENLTALIDNYGIDDLRSGLPHYHLVFHNLSVSEFGNSQINRKRLVLIGIRKDLPKFIRGVFRNVFKMNTLKTSEELMKLVDTDNGNIRENLKDVITLYAGYKDVIDNIRIEWITKRKNENRWKVTDRKFTTAPGVYKNRSFDYPATVRPTNRQFDHNGLMMSPRQLAVIQGIPSTFILYHDTNNLKYCINKGRVTVTKTPPYEIGIWFKKQLKKVKKWM
jgi:site-specific DNA-cytosine methylase